MYLQYRDLAIRNAVSADVPLLVKWWNDGAVMVHAGFPNGLHTTVEAETEQLLQDSDETGRRLIIEHDGIPIGEMCYRNRGEKEAVIGIKICEPAKQEKKKSPSQMNLEELKAWAAELQLEIPESLTKAEILALIKENQGV